MHLNIMIEYRYLASSTSILMRNTFPPCEFFMTCKSSTMRLAIGLALAVTIFVARDGNAVSFRANETRESDYGLQTSLPKSFGAGEFTLDVRVRLDESYPVGRTGPQDSPGQLRNWSSADPAPYSRDDWWFEGNFLLDGHNNSAFWEGTFSIQFCGGGRVRWLFGDDLRSTRMFVRTCAAIGMRLKDIPSCRQGGSGELRSRRLLGDWNNTQTLMVS
jgi:hypothetical protein